MGEPASLTFLGLDPRKAKRRTIEALLCPLGRLEWRRMPALRLAGYAETAARAEAAYTAARRPAGGAVLARLQRMIYGWQYNGTRAYFERHSHKVGVVWNGLNGSRRAFIDGAKDAGARTLFFELAPFKDRVTCDPVGVNQANSLPRDIHFYRDWMTRAAIPPDDWRSYRAQITQRSPAREKPPGEAGEASGPYLFAPLQVPGDSQLRLFGGQFRTVPDFIEALVAAAGALPDGWHLRIKEHPTAEVSYAGIIAGRSARVVLDNRSDTFALVAGSSGVITVNSSVGLEAMFFDKPVVACGQCFWALPGVAETAPDSTSLTKVFARPEAALFNPDDRSAFLSFLLHEYYISVSEVEEADAQLKVRRRLSSDVGNLDCWAAHPSARKTS